jgi:hypothetical protein
MAVAHILDMDALAHARDELRRLSLFCSSSIDRRRGLRRIDQVTVGN